MARRVFSLLGFLACLVLPGGAARAQAGAAHCTVVAGNVINFGAYDPLAAADLTGTGSVAVSCRGPVKKYLVDVALGTGTSGTFFPRRLQHATLAGQTLQYNLYVDAALRFVWGDGTAGTRTGQLDPDVAQSIAIHGAIPAGQNAVVGTYGDTVVVTINF